MPIRRLSLGPQLGCGHCLGDIVEHRDRLVSGRLIAFLTVAFANRRVRTVRTRTMRRTSVPSSVQWHPTTRTHSSKCVRILPAVIGRVRMRRNEDSGRREALVVRYECARTVTV